MTNTSQRRSNFQTGVSDGISRGREGEIAVCGPEALQTIDRVRSARRAGWLQERRRLS